MVEQQGARLLIDTGWPGTLPKLLANLKRKGLALRDLNYVCVTHFHPDHAGLVQELKNAGLKHILLEEQLSALPQLKNFMKPDSGYVDIATQDVIHLKVSDSRAWMKGIGVQGEIISTRGHCDDSISIVLDAGLAFTGDLQPASMLEGDTASLAQQSWELLRQLGVRTIHPGHGPVRPIP